MINKKNMWFVTLFSLILVLSVYYITMPTELMIKTENPNIEPTNSEVNPSEENSALVALRVEKEETVLEELADLNKILTNINSTVEEKNTAYDKMKNINMIKSEEEEIEKIIKKDYSMNSVVTVSSNQIKVVVSNPNHSLELANKIMRTVQDKYDSKMSITVKFE